MSLPQLAAVILGMLSKLEPLEPEGEAFMLCREYFSKLNVCSFLLFFPPLSSDASLAVRAIMTCAVTHGPH